MSSTCDSDGGTSSAEADLIIDAAEAVHRRELHSVSISVIKSILLTEGRTEITVDTQHMHTDASLRCEEISEGVFKWSLL